MKRRATIVTAILLMAAITGYWAHPLGTGPLRGAVHTGGAQDLLCMPDVGSDRFTLGGIHLWNAGNDDIEIKRIELDRPKGVRMGRAYVVGVVNWMLLGSSNRAFPPESARHGDGRLTWMDPRPVADAVITPSTKDEPHELLVELIRTGHIDDISVNAVKIEYSTGWRRWYWTKSTARTVIGPDCR
jgi:hypothetical protein